MTKKSAFLIIFIVQLTVIQCLAQGNNSVYHVSLSPEVVKQGDVAVINITAPPGLTSLSGKFNGNPVFFNKMEDPNIYTGIIGIDMTLSPGSHYLNLTGKDKDEVVAAEVEINIKERIYEIEKLNFPENLVELDDETRERVVAEAGVLRKIWKNVIDERLWREDFKMPVNGRFQPNFGVRRILNGAEKNPHNGIDISATEGTEIISPNRGRVVLVDDHFFGGKTIVLDHGQGLYTTYLHLSEISVKVGDIVNAGEQIGRVGNTGRAKGPHLHWSARLNNARIDPMKLLDMRNASFSRYVQEGGK